MLTLLNLTLVSIARVTGRTPALCEVMFKGAASSRCLNPHFSYHLTHPPPLFFGVSFVTVLCTDNGLSDIKRPTVQYSRLLGAPAFYYKKYILWSLDKNIDILARNNTQWLARVGKRNGAKRTIDHSGQERMIRLRLAGWVGRTVQLPQLSIGWRCRWRTPRRRALGDCLAFFT